MKMSDDNKDQLRKSDEYESDEDVNKFKSKLNQIKKDQYIIN